MAVKNNLNDIEIKVQGLLYLEEPEALFLVVCDPPMNELWAT